MPEENTGVVEQGQERAVETPATPAVDPVTGIASGYQQEAVPQEIKPDPAVEGRIEAVQAIREEKQRIQSELETIRRENEQYRQMLLQQQSQQQLPDQPQENEFPFDEDDYLNAGQIKELLNNQKKNFETQREQEVRVQRDNQMVRNFQEYQKTIPDFLETFNLAGEMVRTIPGFKNFTKILESFDDPIMATYNLGKLHPNYQVKQTASTTQKVVSQIQNNLKQPPTLTNSGNISTPGLDQAQVYANYTDEEILAEVAKRRQGYAS